MLLEEVEHPGNGLVLLLLGVPESSAAYMNMEPAGAGPVAAVAQGKRLPAQFLPWHGVELPVQRQRVGHQLQTIVQGTVVFDVHQRIPGVGDIQ